MSRGRRVLLMDSNVVEKAGSLTSAQEALAREMTEKQLARTVLDAAKKLGWSCYWTWNSLHSPKGWPDLVLLHPGRGRALFRELKREGKAPKPEQLRCLDELAACGLSAGVWFPRDWYDGTILEALT